MLQPRNEGEIIIHTLLILSRQYYSLILYYRTFCLTLILLFSIYKQAVQGGVKKKKSLTVLLCWLLLFVCFVCFVNIQSLYRQVCVLSNLLIFCPVSLLHVIGIVLRNCIAFSTFTEKSNSLGKFCYLIRIFQCYALGQEYSNGLMLNHKVLFFA